MQMSGSFAAIPITGSAKNELMPLNTGADLDRVGKQSAYATIKIAIFRAMPRLDRLQNL
jgi:hypothetical protein